MSSPRVESSWRVAVLGPTVLSRTETPDVSVVVARQDLIILTTLATLAHEGDFVDAGLIEEYSWQSRPSSRALQSSVYRLRNLIGADMIETRRRAIRLSEDVVVDLDEFTEAVARGDHDAALRLGRGIPFSTVGDHPGWREHRARWLTRVDAVRDAHVAELMDHGQLSEAVEILVGQITADPRNGVRWHRLVDGLAGLGRRVEALRAVDSARRSLADAGLEIDAALVERERLLLQGELSVRSPAPAKPSRSEARRLIEQAAEIGGRDGEVDAAIDKLESGLDPVVALVGEPNVGLLHLARAIVAKMASRRWRIVLPGTDDSMEDVWNWDVTSNDNRRVLVAVDYASRDLADLVTGPRCHRSRNASGAHAGRRPQRRR